MSSLTLIKTQIGNLSKMELDKINSVVRSCTEANQWQSTIMSLIGSKTLSKKRNRVF